MCKRRVTQDKQGAHAPNNHALPNTWGGAAVAKAICANATLMET